MYWAEVDWNRCRSCKKCPARVSCKTRAIVKFDADELAYVDRDRCRGCGTCLSACPFSAIILLNDTQPRGWYSDDASQRGFE